MTMYLIIAILTLMGAITITIKTLIKERKNTQIMAENYEKHITSLKMEYEVLQLSVESGKDHDKRVVEIHEKMVPIKKKIKEAKTDEDAIAAIGDIININNSKL